MHAEAAVEAGACEADESAEFGGGPLRGGGGAVDAGGVAGAFLEGGELVGREEVVVSGCSGGEDDCGKGC